MFAVERERFEAILLSIQGTCLRKRLTVATAESCTGGLLAALLTHESGSSAFYLGGVSTYANQAKTRLLQVSPATLESHGAVSAEVAEAMARGARELLDATLALSITGIAGPGGGTPNKPVGTVYIGWSNRERTGSEAFLFPGDREAIRAASCWEALSLIFRLVSSK